MMKRTKVAPRVIRPFWMDSPFSIVKKEEDKMKRSLTGIKPTGDIHLGNYIGAIKPALQLAANHESYYFVANGHGLTKPHQREELHALTKGVVASWLALGLDPNQTTLYRQSDIPEVFELSWILATLSPKGLMNRAHAYKAMVDENEANSRELDAGINMGLFTYPILMAADILIIEPDVVPVGKDQIQHIEIARDLGLAMRSQHGSTVKLPEPYLMEDVAVLPGLDGRKMSKSYGNTIPLFMEKDELKKRIYKIKTNSLPPSAPKDPATSTIYMLYKQFATAEEVKAMEEAYQAGISWGDAKGELFRVANRRLEEPRELYKEWFSSPEKMERVLKDGAEKARQVSVPFLQTIKKEIGLA
ncbi:tryptophanyl-tRNA synthetase [Bacillus sp. JCM 19047]|nr:tryptophanyl-tRNA synthetase [Bacillus sp. JCM 19047]